MKGLSDVLDKDRVARETGKDAAKNLLSDRDLAIAKSEAKELWEALNSRDVTGNVKKTVDGDASMKKVVKEKFDAVMKTPAVKDLTGQEFKPTQYKGPQPVGQPTRLRGFAKTLGIAGGVLQVAQAPAYVEEYGAKRGAWEMFKDVFDPLGVSDATVDPFYPDTGGSSVCDPSSGNCA
jgi:hypothetical protein